MGLALFMMASTPMALAALPTGEVRMAVVVLPQSGRNQVRAATGRLGDRPTAILVVVVAAVMTALSRHILERLSVVCGSVPLPTVLSLRPVPQLQHILQLAAPTCFGIPP